MWRQKNTSEEWIRSNIGKTVYNYDEMGVEAQEAMLKAHLTLAPIFREKEDVAMELRYPFFYDCQSGRFSDEMARENFYQSIICTLGKSRDEDFTLHVLARLPIKWREGVG